MSTPYSPHTGRPDGEWNGEMVDFWYTETGPEADLGPRVMVWEIDASSDTEAEQRTIQYVDWAYEDDLRGGVAASQGETGTPGRYRVHINLPAPRG